MARCGTGNAYDVVVNASPAGVRPDDPLPIDVPHLPATTLVGRCGHQTPLTLLIEAAPVRGTAPADVRPRVRPDDAVSCRILPVLARTPRAGLRAGYLRSHSPGASHAPPAPFHVAPP